MIRFRFNRAFPFLTICLAALGVAAFASLAPDWWINDKAQPAVHVSTVKVGVSTVVLMQNTNALFADGSIKPTPDLVMVYQSGKGMATIKFTPIDVAYTSTSVTFSAKDYVYAAGHTADYVVSLDVAARSCAYSANYDHGVKIVSGSIPIPVPVAPAPDPILFSFPL